MESQFRPVSDGGYTPPDLEKRPAALKNLSGYSSKYTSGDGMDLPTATSRKSAGKRGTPNPHRKYSSLWLGHHWDVAVEVGKWPRIAYIVFGLIIVGIWSGVMVNFATEEVKYEKANLENSGGGNSTRAAQNLLMLGYLRSFDSQARSLVVSWQLKKVGADNSTLEDMGQTPNTSSPLNVFRDVYVVKEEREPTANELKANNTNKLYVLEYENAYTGYRIDNITEVPIGVLGAHPWDQVDTAIPFQQAAPDNYWLQPLLGYPFDQWSGNIVFAFTIPDQSKQFPSLNNSFAFAPDNGALADSALNWRISMNQNNTCNPPDGSDDTISENCELRLDFTGTRPVLVKFTAILAVVVNWAITVSIYLLTCETAVMRRVVVLKHTELLGCCLTALFALPSVRAILPGAPDFGALLDLIGIIPNIIVVSLCTVVTASTLMRLHGQDDKDE